MSARRARIEVVPIKGNGWSPRVLLAPASLHPHYVRAVAANGETLWSSESYATRASAVRAAAKAAAHEGLWVHVLDAHGRILRMIEPTR